MVCDRCNCYFSFWAIFCPFIPLTDPKIKIKKTTTSKPPGEDIIILHMCTKNYDQMMDSSKDMLCDRRKDGWADRKSDIQRWVPHLKTISEQ